MSTSPDRHLDGFDLDTINAAYERIRPRFFTASEHPPVVHLRDRIVDLAVAIELEVPEGRNKSLAFTHLEDLQMRANRGLFAPEGLR